MKRVIYVILSRIVHIYMYLYELRIAMCARSIPDAKIIIIIHFFGFNAVD